MAFVVVQHLDPTHKGIMPELLQRATGMKVIQVKDRTTVAAGLRLRDPAEQGHVHPARHAAPARADGAARAAPADRLLLPLPGAGPAGAQHRRHPLGHGLRRHAGAARHQGAGRRGAGAGPGDGQVRRHAAQRDRRRARRHRRAGGGAAGEDPRLPATHPAHRPDRTRRWKTGRRAPSRRSSSCCARTPATTSPSTRGTRSIAGSSGAWASTRSTRWRRYVRYLQENPQELDLLFKELLIGVTSFFRDPAAWEQLRKQAIPTLLASRAARPGRCARGWPAARPARRPTPWPSCFKEALEQAQAARGSSRSRSSPPTSTGTRSTARARGSSRRTSPPTCSAERLQRLLLPRRTRGYRVRKEIREMVIFAPQNLIMDPPFTKLDILSCRNLLIYLDAGAAEEAAARSSTTASMPGGILFLGSAETIGELTDLFAPLDAKARLYRRRESVAARPSQSHSPRPSRTPPPPCREAAPGAPAAGQPAGAGGPAGPAADTPRRPCWPTTRATSSTSTGGPASTSNRPPARPTGTSSPWPARGCATSWPSAFQKALRHEERVTPPRPDGRDRRRRAGRGRHRRSDSTSPGRCAGW